MFRAGLGLRRAAGGSGDAARLSLFRRLKRKLPSPVRATAAKVGRGLGTAYRVALLRRVTFIGITGSTGKTTTKDLIAAALSTRLRGKKSEGNDNVLIYHTTFRLRPWDDYCVQEVAAAIGRELVPLERPLALVRPRIGVVTNVGTDHLSAFGSKEAIAAEKGKLVEALPADGAAVLNADDPLVLAMRVRTRAKVVTYGLSPDADVRAENVESAWPGRLSFDVVHRGRREAVRTRLLGVHFAPCVLAAIATALEMGVPLDEAARAVGTVEPTERRMEPVTRADGITFVRDDIKASPLSIATALDFVRRARAGRKVVAIGTISDYAGSSDKVYAEIARQALDVADLVLFVGARSSKAMKARKHPKGEALHAFYSAEAAAEYLDGVLRAGDLVLLKGSEHADRFGLILAPPTERRAAPGEASPRPPEGRPGPVRVVVGLGNPGERYRDTPHNVGHRVLDRLARSLGGTWEPAEGALVAVVERQDAKLHLVKLMTMVNTSGPVLAGLASVLGFGPADCLLVHDDLDLALGTSRVRARGSDGGHRGVRSVLQAFGTDAVARVKVGVGRPDRSGKEAGYVVRPFSPEELVTIEAACGKAAEDVLGLVSPVGDAADPPSPAPAAPVPARSEASRPVSQAAG